MTWSPGDAVGLMQEAGIVGAGGAGFPTYVKYVRPPHTLLVNAAESEPGYYADKLLLRDEPEAFVNVLAYLKGVFGIEVVIIAAEDVARPYLAELESIAVAERGFSVAYIDPVYAYGQEKALCREVLGMTMPAKDIPPQHGVVVNNNETIFNIYRAEFLERPVITKFVHVYGEVGMPLVFEAPIGSLAHDLLRIYGADPRDYAHCKLYDGGPILCECVGDPMGAAPEYAVQRHTNALLVVHPEKDRPRAKYYPAPDWKAYHNSIDAPWAPAGIINVEAAIRRVRVPLHGRFWDHGPLTVTAGDRVARGDCIADPGTTGRSIGVHASIAGMVSEITDDHVEIIA